MKVIFHIDELAKWKLTIANVKNFLKEKPDATIEVLANAEAVEGYIDEEILNQILELNAEFVVCANALKAHDIDQEEVNKQIRIVQAGVVELAEKQQEGYAYIRP